MEANNDTERLDEENRRDIEKENSFVKSEIEGLSDLLWSMGARTIYHGGEQLVEWFYSPVPAFDNRKPMDILIEDGEEALYKHMCTLPG